MANELARRAGFTWRDSYAVLSGPSRDETYTDWLIYAMGEYDIVANWYCKIVIHNMLEKRTLELERVGRMSYACSQLHTGVYNRRSCPGAHLQRVLTIVELVVDAEKDATRPEQGRDWL